MLSFLKLGKEEWERVSDLLRTPLRGCSRALGAEVLCLLFHLSCSRGVPPSGGLPGWAFEVPSGYGDSSLGKR